MSNPIFQHRHYVAIAQVFASSKGDSWMTGNATHWASQRDSMADLFASDNPRFDRGRFEAATEGKPSNGRDKVRS